MLDSLPRVRRPTPEEQAVIDAEQRKMAIDPTSQEYARPKAIISELSNIPKDDLSPRQKLMYADALAELGRFDEAWEMGGDERYKQIWDAIHNPSKPCKCRDFETVELVNGVPTTVKHSRQYIKRTVYNVRIGGKSKLVACNVCGHSTIQ